MTKESHQIIGSLTAYAIGLPILPALYFSTLPDIDIKWNNGRSLLTAYFTSCPEFNFLHHIVNNYNVSISILSLSLM